MFLKKAKEFRNGYKDKERLRKIHELPCVVCYANKQYQASKTIAHHKIGGGLGLKVSDLLTMAICENHHTKGPEAIHNMVLSEWEEKYFTQDDLIEMTNKMIENL